MFPGLRPGSYRVSCSTTNSGTSGPLTRSRTLTVASSLLGSTVRTTTVAGRPTSSRRSSRRLARATPHHTAMPSGSSTTMSTMPTVPPSSAA
ncbi:hypothetical protein CKY47_35120 [Saccharothrix yanglingensis]|uniref:Uncharacterized protein n=1 Tax=Saccharothrix yanglingensis TaxID=659496 RepID=A0ABU0XAB0_9PSEU|nr:hypothetical protein [Saccharothrix yanglingensis]